MTEEQEKLLVQLVKQHNYSVMCIQEACVHMNDISSQLKKLQNEIQNSVQSDGKGVSTETPNGGTVEATTPLKDYTGPNIVRQANA